MRKYKLSAERALSINASAPSNLLDEFGAVAADLDIWDDISKTIQALMKYLIKNKDNKKVIKELGELSK